MKEAFAQASDAIIDPYTFFVVGLADADFEHLSDDRRAAGEYGHTAEALVRYGRACLALGRNKTARAALARTIKEDPFETEAWFNLGLAQLLARLNTNAAASFQAALDHTPGDLRYEVALGVARYHQNKYSEAAEDFRRTGRPSGLRTAARSMLGCSLCMQGEWDDARAELGLLKNSGSPQWALVADQCLDCVNRCETNTGGRAPGWRQDSRRRQPPMRSAYGCSDSYSNTWSVPVV